MSDRTGRQLVRRAVVGRSIGLLLAGVLAAQVLVSAPAQASAAPSADAAPAVGAPMTNPASAVDTFIGTLDQGNTFPGASAPFGMTQVSPTGAHFAGWQYDEQEIRGFGHSYISGAGCWEQGGLLSALPTTGEVGPGLAFDSTQPSTFDHEGYAAEYTHEGEVGTAGYYRTRLTSYGGIDVEATATTRVGVQQYTFPATESANVFLNTGQANETLKVRSSSVTVVDDRTIVSEITVQGFCSGQDFTYTTWFATRFDRPFESHGTWNAAGGTVDGDAEEAGGGFKGAWATFDTTTDATVQISTGLSFTSAAGALANLEAEGLQADGAPIPFDDVRVAATAEWDAELSTATIYGASASDATTFYSALYRAFLQPITATDVDGSYMGFDDRIHVADGWTYYQWFSLWDTYRTQNQLLAMLQPDRATDIARSILTIREQGGWLPRWAYANYEANVMTGDPVSPFLADLWRYGAMEPGAALAAEDTLSGEEVELDEQLLFEALLDNVDAAPPAASQFAGRSAIEDYIALGYLPYDPSAPEKGMDTDEHYAGSATMEYALGDCSVSLVAEGLGDDATAARLHLRAGSWLNVWDPAMEAAGFSGFPRARTAAGEWVAGNVGFQEGTPWQYQWMAWQDADGLAATLGGEDAALDRLDQFFDMDLLLEDPAAAASGSWVTGTLDYSRDEYNPNNEPNLHAAWMYSFFGEPAGASAVNRAAQTLFTDAPDGVTGNDDLGTMSAWYVFSAIGMYPSVAGTGDLLLHAPRFEQVDLRLGDGTLTITADGADGSALQYIDAATFDGAEHTSSVINWDAVRGGGALDVTLTDDASTTWAQEVADRPDAPCSTVEEPQDTTVTTLSGVNRWATSAAVSSATFDVGTSAYVASGVEFADALAAGPAAAHDDASLLLTARNALPAATLAELDRLQPPSITIVGGTAAISASVEAALVARFPDADFVRLSGTNRYATAAVVADTVFGTASRAYVASGQTFPDALSASGVAAALDMPVLLTPRAALPAATEEALESLGVDEVVIVGGSATVAVSVESAIGEAVDTVSRLAGANRFATNAALVSASFELAAVDRIVVASGASFADALTATAVVGTAGAPLLLSTGSCMELELGLLIDDMDLAEVVNVGGSAVLRPDSWQLRC